MATRSILGMLYILRGMTAIGENPAPALAKFGLSLDHIDPSARIHRSLELSIYLELAKTLSMPAAGLKVGQYFSLAGYGPFVMLLLTCPTIRQAVRVGVDYQALTFLFGRLHVEYDPKRQQSALVVTPPYELPTLAKRFLIDCEMAGTFKLLLDLRATFLNVDFDQVQVELPIEPPADPEVLRQYQAYYGPLVSFGHKVGRIWAHDYLLDRALITSDSASHALYRQQCDQALRQQQSTATNLADEVRTYLSLSECDVPDSATTAQALDLSERTLRYRLAQLDTSYRQLRDEVRYHKARQYLSHSQYTVDQIADRLGYAESAAFIHAFRRWSGQTPKQYRLQLQQNR